MMSYLTNRHSGAIQKMGKGKRQWGRQRGLYPNEVETALDRELENEAAIIYERLCRFEDLGLEDRVIWAQFLLSQVVRTPSFMKYECAARKLHGIAHEATHDRVGCKECDDLATITSRNWCFMLAHEDDFFVRTDNPVLLTGFPELRNTCLYYPLTPNICFAAGGMPQSWQSQHPAPSEIPETFGFQLAKGGAWILNYYFACSASETLILRPSVDGELAETMFGDVLGKYPQPPFLLHHVVSAESEQAYESIRMLMSAIDGVAYSRWEAAELEGLLPAGGFGASAAYH